MILDIPIFTFSCKSNVLLLFPALALFLSVVLCQCHQSRWQDAEVISGCHWLTTSWLQWISFCYFSWLLLNLRCCTQKSCPHSTSALCTSMQGTELFACIVVDFKLLPFAIPMIFFSSNAILDLYHITGFRLFPIGYHCVTISHINVM